jgi:hypothetical protein
MGFSSGFWEDRWSWIIVGRSSAITNPYKVSERVRVRRNDKGSRGLSDLH